MATTNDTIVATQPSREAKPLAFMDTLSPHVSYFDPGTSGAPDTPVSPHLIMLLTWMNASDAHIAKYATQYRSMFPHSRILLVRSTSSTFIRRGLRREKLEVALPVLRDLAAATADKGPGPQFLVHMFSNGGVAAMGTLWDLWVSELGGEHDIPEFVSFMDSCPGFFRYQYNYHAFAVSLPVWVSPLIHVATAVCWLLLIAWGGQGPQEINAALLNTPSYMSKEIRRTYAYGTGDRTVPWDDVETHAKEAEKNGSSVRMEKFEGGQHVSQVRVDATRYWRLVNETWRGD